MNRLIKEERLRNLKLIGKRPINERIEDVACNNCGSSTAVIKEPDGNGYWCKHCHNVLNSPEEIVAMKADRLKDTPVEEKYKSIQETTNKIEEVLRESLWDNVHAKRKRGEKPAKKGDEDYPEKDAWEKAQKEGDKEDLKSKISNESNVSSSDYEIYHNTLSEAINEIEEFLSKKGYAIDEEQLFQFGIGGISYGQTKRNSFELNRNGEPAKNLLHVQIYRMDSGKYELNMYYDNSRSIKEIEN